LHNHNNHGWAFSLSLIAVIIILAGSAHGAIRVVPDSYPTIQDAINAANSGDTIQVKGTGVTYDQEVVVNKNHILGGLDNGSGLPVVTSSTGDAITLEPNNCEVRRFVVRAADGVGIYVDNSNNHITHSYYVGILSQTTSIFINWSHL